MAGGNSSTKEVRHVRTKLKDVAEEHVGQTLTLCGWVRTVRLQKTFAFIELHDGSRFASFQVIADDMAFAESLSTGCSVRVMGEIVKSPGGKQALEMKLEHGTLLGSCPPEYPLQKKRHSFEFLRTIAHLRPRTNTQGAVARVRSNLAYHSHEFFQKQGFTYLQSPIITASDCEGAGEMFHVTTLDLARVPKTDDGSVDFSQDFFGKPTFLTVSGQLNAESYALALSDAYTFGPTFRAENSHTARHLAEFWMIEPELAFADLTDVMNLSEAYIKYLLNCVLEERADDLEFFDKFIEKGLLERLKHVQETPFKHLTYTKAIEVLQNSGKTFDFPVEWGIDLQTEHERYLAEEHCNGPVILTDYPKDIKAFYMRDNEDGKTVAAMDVIVPRIGEIIGGSQREERHDLLLEKLKSHDLDPETYRWYLDLRTYGSVPHAGFGLGFERLVQFVTGVENIRDAIAFPRVPGNADF